MMTFQEDLMCAPRKAARGVPLEGGPARFRGIVAYRAIAVRLTCKVLRGVTEHGPDHLGFLGMKHRFDLDHAAVGIAPADIAALHVVLWPALLPVTLHQRILPRQLLELRGSH